MAATLVKQGRVETALIGRGLEGFQRRVEVELQPSGIAELDAVLGGGFPRGSLVELCGPASSGRTGLAFSLLAQATERQEACAFVDVSDSLDPISLAAAGVKLPRLLWIRCGEMGDREADLKGSSYFAPADKEIRKSRSLDSGSKKPVQIHGWRHPRELMRGVDANPRGRALRGRTGRERQRTSPPRDSASPVYTITSRNLSNTPGTAGNQTYKAVEAARTSAEYHGPALAQRWMGRRGFRSRRNLVGGCAANQFEHVVSFSPCGGKHADDPASAGRRVLREELRFAGSPVPAKSGQLAPRSGTY